MLIIKAVLFILAIISLYKTFTEDSTKKAFTHLYDATLLGFFAINILQI